jgi:hypothetical protein
VDAAKTSGLRRASKARPWKSGLRGKHAKVTRAEALARAKIKTTTNGAAEIESAVPILQECVTLHWKTGKGSFMKRISGAAMRLVRNPRAHAPSIQQLGGWQ